MVEEALRRESRRLAGEIPIIAYDEWHLPEGPKLWSKLEIPGDRYNGSYNDPVRFNDKQFSDGAGYGREKSHHDRLVSWNERLSVAFAAEHYISHYLSRVLRPKILEIGCWPMRSSDVETKDDNSVIGIISQHLRYKVVGVDNVHVPSIYPYQSYSLPNFGRAKFINKDFYESDTQSEIVRRLGGKPDIIIGNMVFDRRLGNFRHRYIGSISSMHARRQAMDGPDDTRAGERISAAAYNFLKDGGVMVIANEGNAEVPDFIRALPLAAVYLTKNGRHVAAQVRRKSL